MTDGMAMVLARSAMLAGADELRAVFRRRAIRQTIRDR